MSKFRIEKDTMGEMKVPADKYWGSQTQRSFENFKIGSRKMPEEIIKAFAILKKASAITNNKLGVLDDKRAEGISLACDEVLQNKLDGNFPLVVFQTGSGTQSNMNVNEVVARRGTEILKELYGDVEDVKLHPNDHVNKSQSSNDTFPTAMHIAAVQVLKTRLLTSLSELKTVLHRLEEENKNIVKVGRTHLQDAAPLTLGQEISGWRSMVEHSAKHIEASLDGLYELALGGTAVGTGLNAPKGYSEQVAKEISNLTGYEFITAPNKFHSLTSKDAFVFSHGAIKGLAANLLKIANDVRFLASGPRCGIGEITIPENEPGSSIMPGKVNPTQCEALSMVSVQVMGNDTTIGVAASQGNYQLNVYMPLIIDNFLESANLLADAIDSFRVNCLEGLKAEPNKIKYNLENSLMLVTSLNVHIGYENAAKIAKKAHKEGISLKEAGEILGLVSPEDFDKWVDPNNMV